MCTSSDLHLGDLKHSFKLIFSSKPDLNWIYIRRSYVMRCVIWNHLYNFKIVENTHGGVLLLVKLQNKKTVIIEFVAWKLKNEPKRN